MSNYIEFDIEIDETKAPLTVATAATGEGRYVVQTRCPADYGHVKLAVEPFAEVRHVAVEWAVGEEEIPAIYFDAVVEGIRAAASENAGGPVVNVLVRVIGGSTHFVDSRGRSYRVAAKYAFADALGRAVLVAAGSVSA